MSEYFIHSLVKDFASFWDTKASTQELLQKLLQYQERYVERNLITSPEHLQTLANRSPNPELFLKKYAKLDTGKADLLPNYVTLLGLIQGNKGLVEEFRRVSLEKNKNEGSSKGSQRTLTSVQDPSEAETILTQLNNAAEQVKEKKSKTASMFENKEKEEQLFTSDLTIWKNGRPFMSTDFSNDMVICDLLPIGAVPRSSQEKYLVADILQCLLGFHGKYILGTHSEDVESCRTFVLEQSMYAPFKSIALEILVLAEYYSAVMKFIEERQQFSWGRVNQALCATLENLMQDYRVFIIQLEMKHRREALTLQGLLSCIQPFLETMSCLARIAHTVCKAEARGGRTLSLLHDAGKQNAIEHKTADLLVILIRDASVPYFESLEQWIHTGYVNDPCDEFMIENNTSAEMEYTERKNEFSNEYWKTRYKIKKDQVPTFLQQYQQKILRTGKYLNTVKQCKNISFQQMKFILEKKPKCSEMCYTSLNSYEFEQTIETAYTFASDTLLNLLLNEYDIMNRLKSLKRYFLIQQGDFLSIMMDLCEEEFTKPADEIMPNRLSSLIELSIRTCSSGKVDPYKNDVYMEILTEDFASQAFQINSINNADEREYWEKAGCPDKGLTGLDVVTLGLKATWPVSLIFNEKVIGCYQMLFRLLLNCKYVERLLCKVWVCDQQIKKLQKHYRNHYLRAFTLRRKMLLFIQNISYYMTNEVIEQHWYTFLNVIKESRNIDDFMDHHWKYLNSCIIDCMLTSSKLIKPLTWLLKNCVNFCHFIQTSEKASSGKKNPSSFEEKIELFETDFNTNLGLLLKLIPLSNISEPSNQLLHFLNRQNFNGYYTSLIGCPAKEPQKKTRVK